MVIELNDEEILYKGHIMTTLETPQNTKTIKHMQIPPECSLKQEPSLLDKFFNNAKEISDNAMSKLE